MKTKEKKSKSWSEFAKTFLITAVIALLFINFIAHPVNVIGSSMYPTLEDGEYGFTYLLGAKLNQIEREDIVIVNVDDSHWVKRVIGMPNETIECKNDEIYINGNKLDESGYIDQDYKREVIQQYGYFSQYPVEIETDGEVRKVVSDWGPIQLKSDEYFVMGDNRPFSSDSRNPEVGPIHADKLYGKNMLVLFPLNKMGWN